MQRAVQKKAIDHGHLQWEWLIGGLQVGVIIHFSGGITANRKKSCCLTSVVSCRFTTLSSGRELLLPDLQMPTATVYLVENENACLEHTVFYA